MQEAPEAQQSPLQHSWAFGQHSSPQHFKLSVGYKSITFRRSIRITSQNRFTLPFPQLTWAYTPQKRARESITRAEIFIEGSVFVWLSE
jgi:hypothetical protein